LLAHWRKEDAMSVQTDPAVRPWSPRGDLSGCDIERSSMWRRTTMALGKLWAAAMALPDRGRAATPGDVPREFYRYPWF
jgi:hypothetical protein